jgi:hypothetical protein
VTSVRQAEAPAVEQAIREACPFDPLRNCTDIVANKFLKFLSSLSVKQA